MNLKQVLITGISLSFREFAKKNDIDFITLNETKHTN